jgi:hypothetical protein
VKRALRVARERSQALVDRLLERLILAIQGNGPFDGQVTPPRAVPPAATTPKAATERERPRPALQLPDPIVREPARRSRPIGRRRLSGSIDRRRPGTHRSGRHL